MAKETHYYNETRECVECGKRSKFKVYGRMMSFCFIIKHSVHKGKKVNSHVCPKCGVKHPISKEGFRAWRRVSGGRNYYECESSGIVKDAFIAGKGK